MSSLQKKLLREISRLKGQLATIVIVLAGGIMCFVSLRGTLASLDDARDDYYERQSFADVFAHVHRAPESIAPRIEAIRGVAAAETRVTEEVTIPIEGMDRPAWGHLLSLPRAGAPSTNVPLLVWGRFPDRGKDDEVVLLDSFARAHTIGENERVPVVMGGKLRQLRVVGAALSPEFVYAIRPGAIMDDAQRYAVLWMNRDALSSAYDMDGAFDDVSIRLEPGASSASVRADVDRLLAPYGNDGSVAREYQTSNHILSGELAQLRAIAGMVPIVFLGVAAFLINMVLGRMIALQRPEIAALKAIGYTNMAIARHYLGLVAVVMVPAALLGTLGGWALGRKVLSLYATVFRFPSLEFRMTGDLVIGGIGVTGLAAISGALLAVRGAVRLPPAEAMRPPTPTRYHRSLLERMGLARLAGPIGMMILREVERRPLRTLFSALGIGGAVALIVFGHFGVDSLDDYLDGTLMRSQREDLAVSFSRPLAPRAIAELGAMPGVTHVESTRAVPIRASFEHRERDCVLMGLPPHATLRRIVDRDYRVVAPPEDGVLVTRTLGDVLGAKVGDRLALDVREGSRPTVHPVIVAFVDDSVGLSVYALEQSVGRLEGDLGAVSGAMLEVDPLERARVEERLRRSPNVIDVSDVHMDIERLRAMNGSMMDVWTAVSITLGACIIFGVVYNNARIALTLRSRELASLRVLGLTRGEIAVILIGGLVLEVILSVPIGLVLGRGMSEYFSMMSDVETFRFKAVVAPLTYFVAALTAALAAAASALSVRRRLDDLDLIGVLKTRE